MSTRGGDEFHRLRTGYLRLRAALRDPNSGLFTFSIHFDEIRALLADRRCAGVLWVSLGERRLLETIYGWEAYDRVVAAAAGFLDAMKGVALSDRTIIATSGVHADCFTLFTPGGEDGAELDRDSLARLAATVEERLEQDLAAVAEGGLTPARVRVGAALLTDNAFHRFERRVYVALDEARASAERPRDTDQLAWMAELQRLLRDGEVQTVFQPVVELETGRNVGVEAYSRGPEGSVFRLPRVMFSVGAEAGLGAQLDRMCRRLALQSLVGGEPPDLLFLNTTAENLLDPEWGAASTLEALGRAGLSPERVALETPESELGADPEDYREALAPLRRLGYRLSLDDIGSGSRTVTLVEKLRPDFLKFDLTLVRSLGADQLQRELVRSLVQLAERAGARLVVERIETAAERDALVECGARWGQGYLFAPESPRGAAAARGDRGAAP